MSENMEQMLLREYGIRALSLREVPSGWSASAWKVHSTSGDYFLKVYDKHKPSTKSWVERIGSYMPAVLWLHENTRLRGKMTAPMYTRDGAYKWEDGNFLYMVFPFIEGFTIGSEKLSSGQVSEIAQIVSQLHAYGVEIPAPVDNLRETFDVSFCSDLAGWLENMHHPIPLQEALAPHLDALAQAVADLQTAAAHLRNARLRYALCHTDIHGWNMMQSESLILIDWEGLKLAPVEADLFSFTDTFFFAYAWEDFMSVYRAAHKDYLVNDDAMRFYRLRRRLEDIHAFIESILLDDLTQEEMNRPLYHLKRQCELLHGMGCSDLNG